MHKLLTLNGGSGLLLLGLGRTPDFHFAKSEETARRWSHVSFPLKKKNPLGGVHLNVWKDRLHHIHVGNRAHDLMGTEWMSQILMKARR